MNCYQLEHKVLHTGDRVKLRPSSQEDFIDMMLNGRTAIIEAIERDFEEQVHVLVTVEHKTGYELENPGLRGQRFFFAPEEVEPLITFSENDRHAQKSHQKHF